MAAREYRVQGTMWRWHVVLLSAAAVACGGSSDKAPPSTMDTATAKAAVAPPPPPTDGELTGPLNSYSPEQFYRQFLETDSGGATTYGKPERNLMRYCDNIREDCPMNVRASVRSLSLDPLNVPQHGAVVAIYRPAIRKNPRTELKYGMNMHENVKGYFLLVRPGQGGAGSPAQWRLLGIVSRNGALQFHDPKKMSGTYEKCDSSVQHNEPRAGFEPCQITSSLHALSARQQRPFEELLQEYRDSLRTEILRDLSTADTTKLKAAMGGPLDYAWTTCLAGCCRALF